MKLGIIGLPNVGKSTLFNAITNAGAQSENYPFCTIEPNVGVVPVPDGRLDVLARMYDPDKYTPATIEFVDIAGLVRGASRGEGLGNKFLSHIREVDAVIHVVRCFDDTDIIHVEGSVDPVRDMETINLELVFADLEMLERRTERTKKAIKGNKTLEAELTLLSELKEFMEQGNPARAFSFTGDQKTLLKDCALLTLKPVIYAANMSDRAFEEGYSENKMYQALAARAEKEGAGILPICAKIEEELTTLPEEEKLLFLEDLGLSESGLDRLIKESYKLLGLISYLTAGKQEVRAWTIEEGTRAPQAAGKIHTDFERGFIRAEVISFEELTTCGSMSTAKEKGLVRSEGKEYIMKDGDVVLFRFNV